MKPLFKFLTLILLFVSLNAFTVEPSQKLELPKVFLIGEHEDKYEALSENYPTSLIDVSGKNVNNAFKNWVSLVQDMEKYSQEIDFNLDGLKFWINVYWGKDHKIEHIAYYLKPDSRMKDNEDLNAFFTSFINNYTSSINASINFTHSGSATFPMKVAMNASPSK